MVRAETHRDKKRSLTIIAGVALAIVSVLLAIHRHRVNTHAQAVDTITKAGGTVAYYEESMPSWLRDIISPTIMPGGVHVIFWKLYTPELKTEVLTSLQNIAGLKEVDIYHCHVSEEGLNGVRLALPRVAIRHVPANVGDHSEIQPAIARLASEIKKSPADAELYFERAKLYRMLELYDDGIEDCSEGLRHRPNSHELYHLRGVLHLEKRDVDAALEDLDNAVRLKPGCAMCHEVRGNAHADLKQYDSALADYALALQLDADAISVFYNRGLLYNEMNRFEDAIEDFSTFISREPSHSRSYYNRAVAYQALEMKEQAAADFRKADELRTSE